MTEHLEPASFTDSTTAADLTTEDAIEALRLLKGSVILLQRYYIGGHVGGAEAAGWLSLCGNFIVGLEEKQHD